MTRAESPDPQQILHEEERMLTAELEQLSARQPSAFAPREEHLEFLKASVRLSGQIELLHDLQQKFQEQ